MEWDKSKSIIFFDGVCNLCNGFIDFVIKRDSDRHFMYGSLQEEKSHRILEKYGESSTKEISTIVLVHDGMTYKKSKAVKKVLRMLGGGWYLISIMMQAVPVFISDAIYDFVAARRYQIMGKRDSCRIPSEEESTLFL